MGKPEFINRKAAPPYCDQDGKIRDTYPAEFNARYGLDPRCEAGKALETIALAAKASNCACEDQSWKLQFTAPLWKGELNSPPPGFRGWKERATAALEPRFVKFWRLLLAALRSRDANFFEICADTMRRLKVAETRGGAVDAFGTSMLEAYRQGVGRTFGPDGEWVVFIRPSRRSWRKKLNKMCPGHGYSNPVLDSYADDLGLIFSDS